MEAGAREVREQVFLVEQAIDPALEWDDEDALAWHVVVRHGGMAVGTARLLQSLDGQARIGRMAVLPAHRGCGVGSAMLGAALRAAGQRGDHVALLHAQCHAQPFYQRAGFAARGPVFIEAGIPHVEMQRPLP